MTALLPDFYDIFLNLGIWVMIKFTKFQIWQQLMAHQKFQFAKVNDPEVQFLLLYICA